MKWSIVELQELQSKYLGRASDEAKLIVDLIDELIELNLRVIELEDCLFNSGLLPESPLEH